MVKTSIIQLRVEKCMLYAFSSPKLFKKKINCIVPKMQLKKNVSTILSHFLMFSFGANAVIVSPIGRGLGFKCVCLTLEKKHLLNVL